MFEILKPIIDALTGLPYVGGFFEILLAPFVTTEMLWILIPLLISIVLMELYFGRYILEEVGWGSVFGNAIVLIFVGLDLFRFLFNNGTLGLADFKNLLAIGVLLEGVVLTLISFFHLLPRHWAFSIGAKMPTSLIAYISIVLVYIPSDITFLTAIYAFIITLLFSLLLSSFRTIVPKVIDTEETPVEPSPEN